MKTRGGKIEDGRWRERLPRSVLECGGNRTALPPLEGIERRHHLARTRDLPANSKVWRMLLALCLLQSALCLHAWAQPYSIDWHTIDGGGGTSTGGVYSVSGTIGQPDAGGPMTNGEYSVTGGFWALPTLVQTPGAPMLYITNASPGWATIWWEPSTPGFTLQLSSGLAPGAWTNAPSGTNNPALVPATQPTRFYRLHNP